MIEIITRMDKNTRLLWTISAFLVLLFTVFIFVNDVYSTYWGLNDLSRTYGVVVGLPPDSPYSGIVNFSLSFGFGVSALFLMAMAGFVTVQIEMDEANEKDTDRLKNLRGKVLGLAIFLAIIDFGTDVSYRFAEGEGFSQMWNTPTYTEALLVGAITAFVLGLATFYVLRYDMITSAVSGVVLGYVAFVATGAIMGADVGIFISFALSSISTIMVYTFANEVLFAVSASYLMVAVPLVMKDYDIRLRKKVSSTSTKEEPKEVKKNGLSGFTDTIAGFSSIQTEDNPRRNNRSNNR